MHVVNVNNFDEWREKSRALLSQNVFPEEIQWNGNAGTQPSLFHHEKIINISDKLNSPLLISREFINFAKKVACHRSGKQWSLLYALLWRIKRGEKHIMQISTDPLVHELMLMLKAVGRDAHKMKAFVRFKLYEMGNQQHYIAWYEPDHKIVQWVAPFFKRRFSVMQWTIFTPDESVHWDGEQLHFAEGVHTLKKPLEDEMDNLWRTYYRAIFNPARIKLKAMRREMPVRFWPNLPEAEIIQSMLQEAPERVAEMLKHQEGLATSAQDFLPKEKTLNALRLAAKQCEGCKLYSCATQTVFGNGPDNAKVMLIGEQPGNHEDLSGSPFVGPAGQLLHDVLKKLEITTEKIYFTNAVKHFKFRLQDDKRIHVTPNVHEINACKPWLYAEIEAINPVLIVCLGLTASRALINQGFHMKAQRGQWQQFAESKLIMATYHPSAILRAVTDAQKQQIYNDFLIDLQSVKEKLLLIN